MGHELLQKRIAVSTLIDPAGVNGGPVDFNATGDKFILTMPVPILIYRWGFITIAAMDPDAGGFVIALDKRITVGSDTGRVELTNITRADADTVAAGTVVANEVVLPVAEAAGDDALAGGAGHPQTSVVNVGPNGPARIEPGEEVVIEVTNAVGAASTGYVWIEYAQLGFQADTAASRVVID